MFANDTQCARPSYIQPWQLWQGSGGFSNIHATNGLANNLKEYYPIPVDYKWKSQGYDTRMLPWAGNGGLMLSHPCSMEIGTGSEGAAWGDTNMESFLCQTSELGIQCHPQGRKFDHSSPHPWGN